MADPTPEPESTTSAHWYWRILERHGLATVLLCFLIYTVVLPLKDGMIENLKKSGDEAEKQTVLMGAMSDSYKILAASEVQQVKLLTEISTAVRMSNERLEEQHTALEQIEAAVRSTP